MDADRPARPYASFVLTLALAAFALNWLWEMLQMPAYAEMAGRSWWDTLAPCALAALGDVGATLGVYGVIAPGSAPLGWGIRGRWNPGAAAAHLGGGCALGYEEKGPVSGRWSCGDAMPTVA